jgi:hypothetical protein
MIQLIKEFEVEASATHECAKKVQNSSSKRRRIFFQFVIGLEEFLCPKPIFCLHVGVPPSKRTYLSKTKKQAFSRSLHVIYNVRLKVL